MSNEIVIRGSGTDTLFNFVNDGRIRPIIVDGQIYASLVDVIRCYKPKIKNPRQYWKDQKKKLLAKEWDSRDLTPDPELVANLYQLKLEAQDGKKYLTDVAPLWVCMYVAGRVNQDVYKAMAKYTAEGLRYHMMLVGRGMEWASDTIRAGLESDGYEYPDDDNDAWSDLGYRRD